MRLPDARNRNGGMNAATRNGEFSLNHPIVMVCDGVMLPGVANAVIMLFLQVDLVPNFGPTVVQYAEGCGRASIFKRDGHKMA